ncbi:hypothetical protein D3C76_638190 [compost metagenome]|uniref:Multifunctional fatty acid oxidation complex subunit alpha n=1 Tax=Pseudomonas jinjuensis TaxID=198616 RepID=A0A1H0DFQ4_9PSED|nr:PA1571 family protein [Pseudomonas jinjuensis]SDN68938.1 hypothetical protein SAMN05216193_104274 [Pseudomonas jinjuensis]
MSTPETRKTEPSPAPTPGNPQQSVGGSIIDAEGHEIPITEDMIRRACKELDESCEDSD